MTRTRILLLVGVLLLAACASQPTPVAVQPTGTPTATATVQPTDTATPSRTASPTLRPTRTPMAPSPTATPTATPTPSLTPLPTALPAPRPTSAAPPDHSIRSTDWEAVLAGERINEGFGGYMLDNVVYADLDGDSVEEAMLPYHSGGTAGIYHYAVFRQTTSAPVKVSRVGSYKTGIEMQDGYLVSRVPIYAGWEANCCASGRLFTGYTLRGDVLEPVAQWHMGDTFMAEWMLSRYFSSWRMQRYLEGYRLLDNATRAQVPYGEWRRQQDRQRIEPDDVDIAFTPPLTVPYTLEPLGTMLTATISMTGQYKPPGGRPEIRHYTGTWPIAYRPFAIERSGGRVSEGYGWVILTDTLHLVTEPLPTATPKPTSTPRPTRTPIPTPTTPASRISAYTFADADHGWLATDNTLWHTTDGGTTWQPQFDLPEPAEQIVFTSPQQGWIATATGYLVTDDGGATWLPTNASGPLHRPHWYREHCSGGTSRPASISFINDQQGWLLCSGEPGAGHQAKHVRYTDDAGQTWTTRSDSLPSFGAGASIFFLDAQQGWLTTGLGRAYHTTNGGHSWQPWGNVVIEAVRTKTWPFFLSEQHGFVVFWPNQGTNLLVRTTDSGQSWEQIYP